MTQARAVLSGYQILDPINIGARMLLYRAQRQSDGQLVLLKVLWNDYPSFRELLQLRHQYALGRSLGHDPNIAPPLALENYYNGLALILLDPGGLPLGQWCNLRPLDLDQFFPLALALSRLLQRLHQQNIIHKAFNPTSFLIDPVNRHPSLIDLGLASRLPRETQSIGSPNALEGSLAYFSPEQTGRMNRGIDYRTDFYTLGVMFYELLTGQLPFQSSDPMELVHAHLAKVPPLVSRVNPQVPLAVGRIVLKLMAKMPEERYQSGVGLIHDLERCWQSWQIQGSIQPFPLAQQDASDRFVIAERLYGREGEVKTLLAAFDRASAGSTELVMVTGFSGVGKTAVVNEVQKPIIRQRGYFIRGKFDQFQRNLPFRAFVMAFQDLAEQVLGESESRIQIWKETIAAAIDPHAQVLIEVIPALGQLLGPQPPASPLTGSAAQARFNRLMQKLMAVFTTASHPLVIFLDDLQWADSASLKLMRRLLLDSPGHLLLIGAYRDNEVQATHPLMITLQTLAEARANPTALTPPLGFNTLILQPLSLPHVGDWIADTLLRIPQEVEPLVELVFQKAQGNPFFSGQLLKSFHEQGLIYSTTRLAQGQRDGQGQGVSRSDRSPYCWAYDLDRVRDLRVDSDVVGFVVQQLQQLPATTQAVLKLAACVGNQFDLQTLARVYQHPIKTTAVHLWPALEKGYLFPEDEVYKFYQGDTSEGEQGGRYPLQRGGYRFAHDRIQQAAYALIAEAQKQLVHCQIGQLLLAELGPAIARELGELEPLSLATEPIPPIDPSDPSPEPAPYLGTGDRLFAVTNHLNLGEALIDDEITRLQLAHLNLRSGHQALAATAYQAAVTYFLAGIRCLNPQIFHSATPWASPHPIPPAPGGLLFGFPRTPDVPFVSPTPISPTSSPTPVSPTSNPTSNPTSSSPTSSSTSSSPTSSPTSSSPTPVSPTSSPTSSSSTPVSSRFSSPTSSSPTSSPASSNPTADALRSTSPLDPYLHSLPSWHSHPDLTLKLYESATESAYLSTDFQAMDHLAAVTLHHTPNTLDKVKVWEVMIQGHISQDQMQEAVNLALDIIKEVDPTLILPSHPTPQDLRHALGQFHDRLGDRPVADLLHLPPMTDPAKLTVMRILPTVAPATYSLSPLLMPLLALTMVSLSMDYGNTYTSPLGYSFVGYVLCVMERQTVPDGLDHDPDRYGINLGYALGQLALALAQQLEVKPVMACVRFVAQGFINIWKQPTSETLAPLRQTYQLCLESGNLEYAGYSAMTLGLNSFLTGLPLEEVEQLLADYGEAMGQLRQEHLAVQFQLWQQMVLGLLGRSQDPRQLVGSVYDETLRLPQHQAVNNRTTLAYFHICKLMLAYWFGNFAAAETQAQLARSYWDGVASMFLLASFYWFDSLIVLAPLPLGTILTPAQHDRIEGNQQQLRTWASYAPANQQHRYDLVEAERLRVQGDHGSAVEAYDRAIDGALTHHYGQEEAMAAERAAQFYLEWGRDRIAQTYLTQAYYGYGRWGARAKVEDLEQRYSHLLNPLNLGQTKNSGLGISPTSQESHNALDLQAVLKASQVLSGEIYLEQLQIKLMQVVLENAGAETGALILRRGTNLCVEVQALATSSRQVKIQTLPSTPLSQVQNLPVKLLTYVSHIQEPLLMDEAAYHQGSTAPDPSSSLQDPNLQDPNLQSPNLQSPNLPAPSSPLITVQPARGITLEPVPLTEPYPEPKAAIQDTPEDSPIQPAPATPTSDAQSLRAFKPSSFQDPYLQEKKPRSVLCLPILHQGQFLGLLYLENTLTAGVFTHDRLEVLKLLTTQAAIALENAQLYSQLQDYSRNLETEVEERTAQLQTEVRERQESEAREREKSAQLAATLTTLQQTQSQLVQTEKMSSLGQLVAGVAHEINNPVNFIAGNLVHINDYAKDLVHLIDLYQQVYPNPPTVVLDTQEDIDLEFLREDLPKLLRSMEVGSDRIREIVLGLRNFSRHDEAMRKAVDIHEGLDSTLMILKGRLKATPNRPTITVSKRYGAVPHITCFASQLNQVFMNLLANAIDVLEGAWEKGRSLNPLTGDALGLTITVETLVWHGEMGDREIHIRIHDNGTGIPEAIRSKLFDPFFTTKEVGKGTGLGLSISYQVVVDRHGGRLWCESVVGQGTTFTIALPLTPEDYEEFYG